MTVARVENWCVTPLPADPYTPPECRAHGLAGVVYGSDKFPDGASITTSEIMTLRLEGDNVIVGSRSGREYLLGAVDPGYEAAFPNARARVVAAYTKAKP